MGCSDECLETWYITNKEVIINLKVYNYHANLFDSNVRGRIVEKDSHG